jgi:hypothetical protein
MSEIEFEDILYTFVESRRGACGAVEFLPAEVRIMFLKCCFMLMLMLMQQQVHNMILSIIASLS